MPGRPWWRSRAFMSTAAAVVVIAVVVAAFTALHHGGTGSGGGGGGTLTRGRSSRRGARPRLRPRPSQMSGVRTQNASGLGGKPFGVAITADGKYSFISTRQRRGRAQQPRRLAGAVRVATIPAQGAKKDEAITPDGKYLLAAAGSGAYVISVAVGRGRGRRRRARHPDQPARRGSRPGSRSPRITATRLSRSRTAPRWPCSTCGSRSPKASASRGSVGTVPVGQDPVGIAPVAGRPVALRGAGGHADPRRPRGRLYVLEREPGPRQTRARRFETSAVADSGRPGSSCPATANEVWVTDRESNALVAFSAAKLLTKPEHSLIARVNVGQNPIGETFIRGGTRIMVADANLSNYPGAYTLTLVSTQAALQGGSGAVCSACCHRPARCRASSAWSGAGPCWCQTADPASCRSSTRGAGHEKHIRDTASTNRAVGTRCARSSSS